MGECHSIVIGPDKSGTDWIFAELRRLSDVRVLPTKELFFFQSPTNVEDYWSQLPEGIGPTFEVCHDYLFWPFAASLMSELGTEVRLVVIARNPCERLVSSFNYMRYQGRATESIEIEIGKNQELVTHGLYAMNLRPYIAKFGVESVEVIDFEILRSDPFAFLTRVIGPGVVLPNEWKPKPPVNTRREPRSPLLNSYARSCLKQVRRVLGPKAATLVKESRARQLFEKSSEPAAAHVLTGEQRRALISIYRPDALELDSMFNTEFASSWFPDAC